MTENSRKQLTLFVDPLQSKTIEQVRRKFNPIQYDLIKSHVTLCREDEIQNLDQIFANLEALKISEIAIEFGKPRRFSEGKGVFLPELYESVDFQELRKQILFRIIEKPRIQEAHITLMHPRNSNCTDAIFEQIKAQEFPNKLVFNKISLIEQKDGKRWHILKEFQLNNKPKIIV